MSDPTGFFMINNLHHNRVQEGTAGNNNSIIIVKMFFTKIPPNLELVLN